MNPDRTVVVFGATGSVGGQVVAQLAPSGVGVRAVGRDAAALGELSRRHGAEPFVADLTEPATLAPALSGADAVFLAFPSVAGDHAAPATVATLAATVPRLVYLSTAGVPAAPEDDPSTAQHADGGIGGSHALLERLVRSAAREWTFLRASGFATNTLAWAAQTRAGHDEVRWFGPGITRALVHEADLAAVGVRALIEDGHHGAAYHLTGPEALTQVEQVAAIGDALGRPLRFVDVGEEGAPALFAPWPAAQARSLVAAQLAMAEHPEPTTAEVERLLGRPARSYRQWARDHVEDFR